MLNKTLGDLKLDVAKWLNRNDPELIAMIPSWIALAEQECSRALDIPYTRASVTEILTGPTLPIPKDMMAPKSVRIMKPNGHTHVCHKATLHDFGLMEHQFRQEMANPFWHHEHYFAIRAGNFEFLPTAASGDIVVITYHKALEPMIADADTNEVMTYAYDLILYWTLKHASTYMRDPDQEALWSGKAQEAVQTISAHFDAMENEGAPLEVYGA